MKIFLFFIVSSILLFSNETKLEYGKKIYYKTCVSCHGEKGISNPQMRLVVNPRNLSKTILNKEQAVKIIANGAHFYGAHADIMPSFKSVYDKKEIEAVAEYIVKTFRPNQEKRIYQLLEQSQKLNFSEKKMLEIGEKIYKKKCSLCHGKQGEGDGTFVKASKKNKDMIYPYNLQRTLLSEEQIFLYAKYGGKFWGTYKNDMPSWKKKYSDVELKSVAKYVSKKIVKIDR